MLIEQFDHIGKRNNHHTCTQITKSGIAMIPHTLHIKNFLSYGETQIIDFGPYNLICLSGKNGHGKSALLDAITWAVWGCARKVAGSSKADYGLLRLGQSQMMVIFDFILNGKQYRIRREFAQSKGGKPYASLEFGVINTETDNFIPLTDKTIRDTQAKIEETIRLDFDSFINSAFLRQGQSNEFSQKSPKERKEILANILGLGQYEIVRRKALEKVKHATLHYTSLEQAQAKIKQDLAMCGEQIQKLSTVDAQLQEIGNTIAHNEQQQVHADAAHAPLHLQKQQMIAMSKQQKEYDLQYSNYHRQLIEQANIWRLTRKRLQQLPDYHALINQKVTLLAQLEQQQVLLQQSLEAKEQLLKLRHAQQQMEYEHTNNGHIIIEKEAVNTEQLRIHQASLINQAKELEKQYKEYLGEQDKASTVINTLKNALAEITQSQKKYSESYFEQRKQIYQQLTTQGNMLSQQLQQLEQKNTLINNEQDPSCPLCEQNLSATRRRFLKQKCNQEHTTLSEHINRIARLLPVLKQSLVNYHARLEIVKKKQENATILNAQVEEQNKRHIDLLKKIEDTQKLLQINTTQQKESTAALLKQEEYLKKIKTEHASILLHNEAYQTVKNEIKARELAPIIYSQVNHKAVQTALNALEQDLHNYQQAQQQKEAQDSRMQAIKQTIAALKQIKKVCAELKDLLKQEKEVDAQLEKADKDKELHLAAIKNLHKTKEELLQAKGELQAQKTALVHIEKQYNEHTHSIDEMKESIDDYTIIATATSKDGIQALLIEEAIPEIEQEANNLLSKLTNNQAQLFIESLRDLKKGGTKETLDIKISDPVGIRPYELFSGGEAFRIDFALRIAISKLLARRAGTALQTLIIDEGFGSQDEEGLGHIMDALYKIQDDFAKIIIVSHLPSMKDQFPVHFSIEKTPLGSRVTVIEHE